MFHILKKNIHEPVRFQRKDLDCYPAGFREMILQGENCDALAGGYGAFGSLTNPIPVNGAIGEIKYLGKLRSASGFPLFFHRLASAASPVCDRPVDLYQVVGMDGKQWGKLYLSMYHPRRSNMAPAGYSLKPFGGLLRKEPEVAYGIDGLVENFPFGLPSALVTHYGPIMGRTLARQAQASLERYDFTRNPPQDQPNI